MKALMRNFSLLKNLLIFLCLILGVRAVFGANIKSSKMCSCDLNNPKPLESRSEADIKALVSSIDSLAQAKKENCGFSEGSGIEAISDAKSFITAEQRQITKPTLFVIHAQKYYGESSKGGIDSLVATSKARGQSVVYMLEEENVTSWYPEDREPHLTCISTAGDNNFDVRTKEVIVTGGLYGACHRQGLGAIVRSAIKNNQDPVVVHLPMDAITQENESEHSNIASWLTKDTKKNESLIAEKANVITKKSICKDVDCKVYFDGKLISTEKAITANPRGRSVELKFWSTSDVYRKTLGS